MFFWKRRAQHALPRSFHIRKYDVTQERTTTASPLPRITSGCLAGAWTSTPTPLLPSSPPPPRPNNRYSSTLLLPSHIWP
ncbi:hypothetical protein BDV30DRAFT_207633 [Aspergillus minisclerotigenes]|uniref:Uncharacterized protein n=1 Tax=Aspergillus minisclerotigenes TaxID=656917 RepID=A0A5N6JC97_9EURO|nr:hypothetical protein BDV30DRAFT_207633 [Aspergillus minisclerotigenes]